MSAPTGLQIGIAGVGEVGRVTDLIATAFHDLAVSHWLVDEPAARLTAQRGQFALVVEHAVEHGLVYLTEDGAGTAVWVDRTRPIPEPAGYDGRLREVCGKYAPRFIALDAAFEEHHPQALHHHLAFMAVRPEHQGRGLGTALLNHHHRVLDRDRTPAYLEASNLRTSDFYARYGYRVVSRLDLPDGPSMWPMWRDPAASSSGEVPRARG